MNILITTGIFPPDVGGPAKFVPLVSEKLSEQNNVKIITLADNIFAKESLGMDVKRIKRNQNKILRVLKTIKAILKYGFKSDVIFVNGLWMEVLLSNLILRKKTIRKIVGDPVWEKYYTQYKINDGFDEFQTKKYQLSIQLFKKIRNISFNTAETIIVPSEHLKSFVKNCGYKGNIQKINNGTQISKYFSKNYDENNFLIVSRLVRHKNIDLILKSFKNLKNEHNINFTLRIVGQGPELKKLQKLINDLDLKKNVELLGPKFDDDLKEIYKISNYFIQISSYEGMPHSILEALNYQLIVIASKFGGNFELIGNNTYGYLTENFEINEISKVIYKAISEKRDLSENCKYLVSTEFNIENTINNYSQIILNNEQK